MKNKSSIEYGKFDTVMGCLLAVPYDELQKKLEAEKRTKATRKKKRLKTASSRASSSSKRRVA